MKLEKMDEFFEKRIDEYEHQMLFNVEGLKEGYQKIAELIPEKCSTLLDLGCGTGIELKLIFKRFPNINVTGIDLTQKMLDKLKENYPNKDINLICGSYFDVNFGKEKFDCVISFETMHHFTHESKIKLYTKIYNSLNSSGLYIEGDYIAEDQEEEDFYFQELSRMRKEQNIPENIFVHYDTPCTMANQINMFRKAGFKESSKVWQKGSNAIIVSKK